MILYHFTSAANLESIRLEGITRGHVDLSYDPRDQIHAIRLTYSSFPVGLRIDLGPEIATDAERMEIFTRTGTMYPPSAKFADFRAVRIQLELSADDPALLRCREFRTRILPSRRAQLERNCKPGTRWVYLGVIPPENFSAIHFRHGTEYREDAPRVCPGTSFRIA